jgi:hypothetical protein
VQHLRRQLQSRSVLLLHPVTHHLVRVFSASSVMVVRRKRNVRRPRSGRGQADWPRASHARRDTGEPDSARRPGQPAQRGQQSSASTPIRQLLQHREVFLSGSHAGRHGKTVSVPYSDAFILSSDLRLRHMVHASSNVLVLLR